MPIYDHFLKLGHFLKANFINYRWASLSCEIKGSIIYIHNVKIKGDNKLILNSHKIKSGESNVRPLSARMIENKA